MTDEDRRLNALQAAIAAQPANSGVLAGQVGSDARANDIVVTAKIFEDFLRGSAVNVSSK